MQVIEQLFTIVVYLFWVLVFAFLLIAWRPGRKRNSPPVLPVTGDEDCLPVEDCKDDAENPSA